MIPKIIHYCWFGNNELPEEHQNYITNWKALLPNFRFMLWNEMNAPMHLPYMREAFKNQKWANLSNYTRLYALYHFGGIYMDTDVEMLKPFDEHLLKDHVFLGFEEDNVLERNCVNNAVMGAVPEHPFLNEAMAYILEHFDGNENAHLSSPVTTTKLLKDKGLDKYTEQYIEDIKIYPKEYFYPFSWREEFTKDCIKPETILVHHMAKSWWKKDSHTPIQSKPKKWEMIKNIVAQKITKFLYNVNFIKWQWDIFYRQEQDIYIKNISEVLNGIFSGIRYANHVAKGSSVLPKLIGTYEWSVQKKLYQLIQRPYKYIFNIGCDEGYYAIGLGALFPKSEVIGYDTHEEAIRYAHLNLSQNTHIKNVVFQQEAVTDSTFLKLQQEAPNLFLCDCEGAERFIFCQNNIHVFRKSDLIIELHPFFYADVKTYLIHLFKHTHTIEILPEESPELSKIKKLERLPFHLLKKAMNENRPEKMEWLYLQCLPEDSSSEF